MGTPIYDSLTEEQQQIVLTKLPIFGKKMNKKQLENLIELVSESIRDEGEDVK